MRLQPSLLVPTILAVLMASPASAAVTYLNPGQYDAQRGAVVVPYVGPFPSVSASLSQDPPQVHVDFDAIAGLYGVYSSGSPQHPNLEHWLMTRHDGGKIRLTLTFKRQTKVSIFNDTAKKLIVVMPQALPVARATPTPTPSPTPEVSTFLPAEPIMPTPAPMATPTPTPVPTPTPTPVPTPTPTPRPTPTPTPQPTPTPTPVPTPTPTPRPTPTPTPRPTPTPTPRPTPTPTPRPTPRPTATPRPTPVPTPTPMPRRTPKPVMTPHPLPTPAPRPSEEAFIPDIFTIDVGVLELSAGRWFTPSGAGAASYDFSFQQPTWMVDATFWRENLGLTAGFTLFNTTYAAFRSEPYFQPNTFMYDLLARYRKENSPYELFGGYRGLGVGDVHFATIGGGFEHPLMSDLIKFRGTLQSGGGIGMTSIFFDAQGAVVLNFAPFGLELGFRHFTLQAAGDPVFNINGPTAELRYQF